MDGDSEVVANNNVDEMIILEVQVHPLLWNTHVSDYKRHDKKKIVWNSIATKLGLTGSLTLIFINTKFYIKNYSIFSMYV